MKPLRNRVVTKSLPAPVGGWNARDSLADMAPYDAVILDNFFPLAAAVQLRKGYTQHATGMGTNRVDTLMAYNSPTGTQKLFAVAGGSIYDATSSGAVGAATVSGLTNSRPQYVNISTSGGNFLLSVNGADKLRGYDGSAWWTDGDASHDITGLDTATVATIALHKNRVWMTVANTLKAYYLGTNSISGAASLFDLSSVADQGGQIMAIATWTLDAGAGVDDFLVFVTSVGEIIVYQGTDPSSSTTWALKGIWRLGSPLGRRCLHKYGGDVLIACQDGVLPLAAALQSDRLDTRIAISDKIQPAMTSAAQDYGDNFGWQILYYPGASMLILNVPTANLGTGQQQFVMNTITKAWGRFKPGFPANCWAISNDDLYFGAVGYVGKAWGAFADNGVAIAGDCQQAFSNYGNAAVLKRWTMARPYFQSTGTPSVLMNVNTDFTDIQATSALVTFPSAYGMWGVTRWDGCIWGSDLNVSSTWIGLNGIGYWGAPRLNISASGIEVRWVATDMVMEKGGVL